MKASSPLWGWKVGKIGRQDSPARFIIRYSDPTTDNISRIIGEASR
jgi:hypothetical protein